MAEKKLYCLVVFRPTPLKNDGVKVSKFYESQLGLFRVWGIGPAKVCEASKLQSLKKAPKPLWRLTPQSLKAAKPLWRLTLQSLKASKPERLDALALWRLAALSGFGASWRFSDASKPQSLNAWMLWRFGACRLLHALALLGAFPTPQSLKA